MLFDVNKMIKRVVFVLALFATTATYADSVYDKHISLMGFKLEETNLYKIREVLGSVPIIHTGDAADSYYGICYTSKPYNITVHFESGEMGGNQHTLLSFVVTNSVDQSNNCGDLTVKPKALKLGSIMLGKDINSIKGFLPQPLKIIDGGIVHQHISKIPFSKNDISKYQLLDLKNACWYTSIAIEIVGVKNLISSYRVSKITTW